jgi:Mg2+ and Co2+ transporter CorA
MPLHRSANNLSAALQSAREFVPEDAFIIAMRDEAYELARGFHFLLNDAKLQLDYRIAESSEEQSAKAQELARAQHKLNVLAAITFPLIALGTIFGMSLATGLEGRSPLLFWFLLALGAGTGLYAMMWVMDQ